MQDEITREKACLHLHACLGTPPTSDLLQRAGAAAVWITWSLYALLSLWSASVSALLRQKPGMKPMMQNYRGWKGTYLKESKKSQKPPTERTKS